MALATQHREFVMGHSLVPNSIERPIWENLRRMLRSDVEPGYSPDCCQNSWFGEGYLQGRSGILEVAAVLHKLPLDQWNWSLTFRAGVRYCCS